MPNFGTDSSPFAVRVRPGKRREELSSKKALALRNPSLTGHSSTSSTASGTSTESEDSSEDEISLNKPPSIKDSKTSSPTSTTTNTDQLTYARLLPSMHKVYGMDVHEPARNDVNLYRRYAGMAGSNLPASSPPEGQTPTAYKRLLLAQQSAFTVDNTIQITTPFVAKTSLDVYVNYFLKGRRGKLTPNPSDLSLYRRYAAGSS